MIINEKLKKYNEAERDNLEPLTGVIRRTPMYAEVYFEDSFDVSIETLWNLVADPDKFAIWAAGSIEVWDFSVGGACVFVHKAADGSLARIYAKYIEIDQKRKVVMTWDIPAWGKPPEINNVAMIGTEIRIEIIPDGNGSIFKFTHALPHAIGKEHVLAAAWHGHLNQFKHLAAGATEAPFEFMRTRPLMLSYFDKDAADRLEFEANGLGLYL